MEEFSRQMERLIDARYPGRGSDAFGGWMAEMRRTHGHQPLRVLTSAVSIEIDRKEEDGLPSPGDFRVSVEAAKDKAERDEIAGLLTSQYPETPDIDWSDPWSSTPTERQGWAKEDQWIRGWYRNVLPHRDPPEVLWRVPSVERAAIIGAMLNDDQVGNRPNLRPGDRRRMYGSPDPDVRNFIETRTNEERFEIFAAQEKWNPRTPENARAAVLAIKPRPDKLDEHVAWYIRLERRGA
jgi:hypothetical protein